MSIEEWISIVMHMEMPTTSDELNKTINRNAMEEKMTRQEIVESYLEDYFGHDLFETLEAEEVAEAIMVLNNLTEAVNDFFEINEGEDGVVTASKRMRHHNKLRIDRIKDRLALVRRGLESIEQSFSRSSGSGRSR